jgi:hypothetical protein
MVYQWKTYQYPVDAQLVGEEFEKIGSLNSGLTPDLVVAAAVPINSVLHNCFDWDNEVAGDKWRKNQAGQMIRTLVVCNPKYDQDSEKVIRAYVNIECDNNRLYLPTAQALSDADYRAQVLNKAIIELLTFENKYKDLLELADVFIAIEDSRRKLMKRKPGRPRKYPKPAN